MEGPLVCHNQVMPRILFDHFYIIRESFPIQKWSSFSQFCVTDNIIWGVSFQNLQNIFPNVMEKVPNVMEKVAS